eukprot:jgi/Galph1/5700/GphlegSOOS_G4351.1
MEDKASEFDLYEPEVGARTCINLFYVIESLCRYANIFCMVAGTCEREDVASLITYVTRVLVDDIPLLPLRLESIKEYLEKSCIRSNKAHVGEIICGNNEILSQQMAEWLFEVTNGVPGLLASAVDALLEYALEQNEPCLSKHQMVSLLSDTKIQHRCAASIITRVEDSMMKKGHLFNRLMLVVLFHFHFCYFDQFNCERDADQKWYLKPILDLCVEIGFYYRSLNNFDFHAFLPKMVIAYLRTPLKNDGLQSLLVETLYAQRAYSLFPSKCYFWAGLTALQLYRMFSSTHSKENIFMQILFQLSSNHWMQMNLTFSDPAAFHYIQVIDSQTTTSENPKSLDKNEWTRLVENSLEYEKLYLPIDSFYLGPDILFKLRAPTGSSELLVGIACKSQWSISQLTWKDIVEEANRFFSPVGKYIISSHRTNLTCILIIVNIYFSREVAEVVDSTRYFSASGVISDYTIPSHCELIILSETDARIWLGENIFEKHWTPLSSYEDRNHVGINPRKMEDIVESLEKE